MKRFKALLLCCVLTASVFAGCTNTQPTPTPQQASTPQPSAASTPATSANSATDKSFEESIVWDAEYDVVVVGFGGAGAVASITAADAGAKVLMLEKAPKGEEGGNSRYAAQIILAPTDREKAITYFKAMRGGYDSQSDLIIETIVDGAMQVRDWLTSMGATKLVDFPLIEYPELAGSDGIATVVIDGEVWTSKMFSLLRNNVASRSANLDVWYSSPGKELIQDPTTKIILGVKAEVDGKLVNIRAINGVVLTTGGFENNKDMVQNYVQMPYAFSKGAQYNDGDGIKMAMRVGADLWHMSTLSGPDVGFKAPDTDTAFGYGIQWPNASLNMFTGVTSRSVIFVGSDGTRFVNEGEAPRHGHINNHGTWISMQIPTPSFMIFDETARLAGPIYPSWSADNSAELAKGYIVKGDTIAELAAKIGVDPAALEKQINTYNQYCANGEDLVFGRDPQYLKPLQTGPYYSLELSPFFTNTQGGPKRNEKTEVLDVDGNPIPHLYSAGELGSYYADIYNGGGNLSECIFSGRTAGTNATAAKSDVSNISLMNGKTPIQATSTNKSSDVSAAAGTLVGEGTGMGGKVTVQVKLDDDKIASVEILSHSETPGISDKAISEIPKEIITANSAEVDVVTGATVSSKAIMAAVADALSKK